MASDAAGRSSRQPKNRSPFSMSSRRSSRWRGPDAARRGRDAHPGRRHRSTSACQRRVVDRVRTVAQRRSTTRARLHDDRWRPSGSAWRSPSAVLDSKGMASRRAWRRASPPPRHPAFPPPRRAPPPSGPRDAPMPVVPAQGGIAAERGVEQQAPDVGRRRARLSVAAGSTDGRIPHASIRQGPPAASTPRPRRVRCGSGLRLVGAVGRSVIQRFRRRRRRDDRAALRHPLHPIARENRHDSPAGPRQSPTPARSQSQRLAQATQPGRPTPRRGTGRCRRWTAMMATMPERRCSLPMCPSGARHSGVSRLTVPAGLDDAPCSVAAPATTTRWRA